MAASALTRTGSATHSPLATTYRPPSIKRTDWVNVGTLVVLATLGVLFIRSAQFTGSSQQWVAQIVWLTLGAGIYAAIAALDYHVWLKNAHLVYLGSLLLLALIWTPLGTSQGHGARRWIGLGSHTIQPSEFAKIGTLIMVAAVLAREELGGVRKSLAMLVRVGLVVAGPIVLIFLQPDLGSSMVFFPMVFAQLFVSKLSVRFFATVFLLFLAALGVLYWDMGRYVQFLKSHHLEKGVVVSNDTLEYKMKPTSANVLALDRLIQSNPALVDLAKLTPDERAPALQDAFFPIPARRQALYLAYLQDSAPEPDYLTALEAQQAGAYDKLSWLPLKGYQRNRILSFLAPEVADPQGIGATWNLRQSQIAVGSGGLAGKGYENGTQARLGYLSPREATNDFIMAVFLEETGFVGGLAVIGLYAILMGDTLRIAWLARDRFGQLLCVGVAAVFLVHVFVNIGMVQGLMPIKGIPLPLMSYGGSFVLVSCALMGLVQSVYRFRREAV